MKMTGARILVECLKREGVECIFGFPGAVILPIYDQFEALGIRHVLTRHEQGAIHAAVGYARATGKVGVVLVTSGPGATNLVTGIADAYMDSIPVVAFTGQVPQLMIGNDAFQEADIVGITRSITKHNYLAQDVAEFAFIVRSAFHIAGTGRPGPVLIDMPKDILNAETEFVYPEEIKIRGYNPNYYGNLKQIKLAAEALARAQRPVIYSGGGVITSGASAELRELVRLTQIPITSTLMGLGAFPGDDPLFLGMPGMHGTQYANLAITACDLLIAIGARFDDRVTGKVEKFAPHAEIIHIDIDPSAISKNIKVDIPIVGDVKNVLVELNKIIQPGAPRAEWLAQIAAWKQEKPLTYEKSETVIKPQQVIEEIAAITQGKAIITTEVGQHQMWAALFGTYYTPRSFISSGGLGVMGFGFPAAIGAQAGCPDKLVIDIAGDGSIQMVIQELATAVCGNFPVKVVIMNNGYLGMIRQWQDLFFGKRFLNSCLRHPSGQYFPDFVKLAEAYGAVGIRIEKPAELRAKLTEAFALPQPVFIDVIVAEDENVFPMVPAGAGIADMLIGS